MIRSGQMGEIQELIQKLGKEIQAIVKQALELSYFSRGGWSYETVLSMSAAERDLATEFIQERLKNASKMSFPVF